MLTLSIQLLLHVPVQVCETLLQRRSASGWARVVSWKTVKKGEMLLLLLLTLTQSQMILRR
jgi:hypothetical protein